MVPKSPAARGSTLHMVDPMRFSKIRRMFKARGDADLSLVKMIGRIVDEWLRAENGKPKE